MHMGVERALHVRIKYCTAKTATGVPTVLLLS
jgi:hypothetical protein